MTFFGLSIVDLTTNMGGCIGKSSYGPWRSRTANSSNENQPKKKKKEKLYISIRERKSANDETENGDDNSHKRNSA